MKTCPKMQDFVERLALKHGVDLSLVGAHLRVDLPGFDRLVVERLTPYAISVAHYFEQNGDLVPEPDIVYHTQSSEGWVPIEIAQSLMGFASLVAGGYLGPIVPGSQSDNLDGVAVFSEMWADNLLAQGWLEKGERYVYADSMPVSALA